MAAMALVFGAAVRAAAVLLAGDALQRRVEIATPASAILDVKEAVFLADHGVDAYDGDAVLQPPLVAALLRPVLQLHSEIPLAVLFILMDLAAALLVGKLAQEYQTRLQLASATGSKPSFAVSPDAATLLYLFNPYSIAACAGMSTSVVSNLVVLLALYWGVSGATGAGIIGVALAAYLNVYPIMLALPMAAFIVQHQAVGPLWALTVTATILGSTLAGLLYASAYSAGSWTFLQSVYQFSVNAPDLAPNLGLSWYFFMEIFGQFRVFFRAIFQLHLFLYAGPVAYRFWTEPLFMAYMLTTIAGIFKPYPTVADIALSLTLLSLFSHTFERLRYTFVAGSMLLFAAVLGPVFWHIWVLDGSGNANFFYAVTLVHGLGQILLFTDAVHAFRATAFVQAHPELAGADLTMR